jgi:hypothetical protein
MRCPYLCVNLAVEMAPDDGDVLRVTCASLLNTNAAICGDGSRIGVGEFPSMC